jgi:transposase-like protein
MRCPSCQSTEKQYKSGFNRSGSQRYRCGICNRAYTPEPKKNGYPSETRLLALRMYLEGNSTRAIGRILQVSPQSVSGWVSAYVDRLPETVHPKEVHTAELDELYTFIGNKKTKSTS